MRCIVFLALCSGLLVSAIPLDKRQSISSTDATVLQLALYLEHLEYAFYSSGCSKYTDAQFQAAGFPTGYQNQICITAQQEQTHIDTITKVLTTNGQTPIPACTYTFPYSDPKTFSALANMISTVGIGAYLGGATSLMDNPTLLTDAASILSVEARHVSYIRAGAGASPFPTPFDTSLTAVYAYNLAQMFIVSCPQNLPIIILPKLTLASPTPALNLQPPTPAGTVLTFKWDPTKYFVPVDPNAPLYIGFINQYTKTTFAQITPCGTGCGTVPVPQGLGNIAFAVLTTFGTTLTEDQYTQFGTLAGPVEVPLS